MSADRLLLVFVHGFRGSDTTFKDFPNRLKAISPIANLHTIVYPQYKTAGDFKAAASNLLTWLQNQIVSQKRDMTPDSRLGIVLLGHSMGGLVSAEVILMAHQQKEALQGAEILGLVAYDTPFYSVNHRCVSTTALSHVEQVNRHIGRPWRKPSSTATVTERSTLRIGWKESKKSTSSSWGLLAGAVGLAAVGAAAYFARDKISAGITNVFDHLEFVSTLMDLDGCWERVNRLTHIPGIMFKCFYVQLKHHDKLASDPRTFIALPPPETAHYFVPVESMAENEIDAHTSMFDPSKNDHYYTLGLDSMAVIAEMFARYQSRFH